MSLEYYISVLKQEYDSIINTINDLNISNYFDYHLIENLNYDLGQIEMAYLEQIEMELDYYYNASE